MADRTHAKTQRAVLEKQRIEGTASLRFSSSNNTRFSRPEELPQDTPARKEPLGRLSPTLPEVDNPAERGSTTARATSTTARKKCLGQFGIGYRLRQRVEFFLSPLTRLRFDARSSARR
jgi:hypothetical protein